MKAQPIWAILILVILTLSALTYAFVVPPSRADPITPTDNTIESQVVGTSGEISTNCSSGTQTAYMSPDTLSSHWVTGYGYRDELNKSDEDYYNFWADNAGKILSMAMITGDATDASRSLSFLESQGLGSASSTSSSYYLPEVLVNSSIVESHSNVTITNRIVQLVENTTAPSLQSLAIGNCYAGSTTMGYLGSDRILVSGKIYSSTSSIVSNIPRGFSKRSFFETSVGDFYLYLNATLAAGEPYANVSIQVLPLNSSLSSSDLLYLQVFSSEGQFDNASLYGQDGSFLRQLVWNNGSPATPNGLIIPYSKQFNVLDEDSVAVSFNNSIANVDDLEHWYHNGAFDSLSWIGIAYNATANSVGVLSQPISSKVYPLQHLDYHLVNDTARYIASNPVNVAVTPPVGFGFISYGLALDAAANPQNATLTSLARGYWNFYYARYNSSNYSTPYARSINVFALAGFKLYGCNSTVESFTRRFLSNTSGDSIEEYAWGVAALNQLYECTNSQKDYSLYQSFLGSLSAGGSHFMALDQSSTKNQLNPEPTFEFGETASGLMLGGVPFNYPTVISAMNAVYQSNVKGETLNYPYYGDEMNTETLPAYNLSTWLFEGEMRNETGYWITGLENMNVTAIAYSSGTLLIQAVGSVGSSLTLTNKTGSYVYPVEGFETITLKLTAQPCGEAITFLSGALMGAVVAGVLVYLISRRHYRRLARDKTRGTTGNAEQLTILAHSTNQPKMRRLRQVLRFESPAKRVVSNTGFVGTGQGVLAFIGSIALVLLILEWILSSALTPSELGLPDYWVLATVVMITAFLVVSLYRKFGVSKPAWIGGGVGTALAILAIIVITIIAFLGYIATGPP